MASEFFEKTPYLTSLFLEKGTSILILNQYRILLENEDNLFYVEEGNFDLFIVELTPEAKAFTLTFIETLASQSMPFLADIMAGPLTFLRHIPENTLLFPFAFELNRPYHVVAVANQTSRLRKINKKIIQGSFKQNPPLKHEVKQCLEDWLAHLSSLFVPYRLDYTDIHLHSQEIMSLQPEQTVSPEIPLNHAQRTEISWIQIKTGALFLFDIKELAINPSKQDFYPCNSTLWFKNHSFTQLYVRQDEGVFDHWSIWRGIDLLLQHILRIFVINHTRNIENERDRNVLAKKIDERNLKNSLHELRTIFDEKNYLFQKEEGNLLYKTCQLIGNRLELHFIAFPPIDDRLPIKDRVYSLCFQSHTYYREVNLTENWWHQNLGPLLGFYGEEEKPVALIPTSDRNYQMVDLERQLTVAMTQELNHSLSSTAIMFYRSFPNKKTLTTKDLLKFSTFHQTKNISLIILFGFLSTFLALFIPFANRVIFDLVIPNSDSNLLNQITFGLLIVSVSSSIFNFARESIIVLLEGVIEHDLEAAIWQRIFSLPINFFRRFEIGELILYAFSIGTIRERLVGPTLRIFINSIFLLVFLFPMFYYSWVLSLVGMGILLIGIIVTIWAVAKTFKRHTQIFKLFGNTNSLVLQFLYGISKIRLAGAENLAFVLWEKTFYQIKKTQWLIEKIDNWAIVTNATISTVSLLAIYTTAIYLLEINQTQITFGLSIGDFIAFIAAFVPLAMAVTSFNLELVDAISVLSIWKRSRTILEEPAEIDFLKATPGQLNGGIRVEHVSFRYNKNSPLVLEDISLHADVGEFIALVGASGSGKSSLIRLLIGFEIQESGVIYFDGKELSTLDLRQLRKQVGVVMQTSTILEGTLRENIVSGGYYSDEEIKRALDLAGFQEDLQKLPMGLNTILTNAGTTFSGGQKQRVLLARALIGKPKILILDEATSALDNITQEIIKKNLDQLNITRIVIAHRLSTIRRADRIYVLNKGKITGSGTFEELSNQKEILSLFTEKT